LYFSDRFICSREAFTAPTRHEIRDRLFDHAGTPNNQYLCHDSLSLESELPVSALDFL
jgi:hypothetical protein